ncbi:ankyrin and armadillo repeat-containing protein-like [Rana temporaria]|uniref:ankyrin and armadillo repeat-containing protein-like n=1 Tax=Rana temporaria TaxID=8407 RepID=UPI001AAD5B96|nr:ankyrin and armadillo repeat-containing protein-like [Rana temporaria]
MEALERSGWSELHHAAYKNHVSLVERLIESSGPAILDTTTDDSIQNTPLLLAVSSGSHQMVNLLVKLGAVVTCINRHRQGVVEICALQGHLHLLQYFIGLHNKNLNVYKKLIALLDSDEEEEDHVVGSCSMISQLTSPSGEGSDGHLKGFIEEGLVSGLVGVLRRSFGEKVKATTLYLLKNILRCKNGRRKLLEIGGIQVLVSLMDSKLRNLFPTIMDSVCELSAEEDSAEELSKTFIPTLREVLSVLEEEAPEEVLQPILQGTGLLAASSPPWKDAMGRQSGLLTLIVKLFQVCQSKPLLISWSDAVGRIAEGHQNNQSILINENAGLCLHHMMKSKNRDVQMSAVETLYRLVEGNPHTRRRVLESGNLSSLIHLLRRSKSQRTQEAVARALWTLAGDEMEAQRMVAARIGVPLLVEFLSLPSCTLNLIGTGGLSALVQGPYDVRNAVMSADGARHLVRLLRSQEEEVVLSAIRALQHICLGVGFVPHVKNQCAVASSSGLKFLIALMRHCDSERVRVEASLAIAASVLGNPENLELISKSSGFSYSHILRLLHSPNDEVRLTAGAAIATFAFNSPSQQKEIVQSGGVTWDDFSPFLETDDENLGASTAFQLVVLAPIIPDKDPSYTCAVGIQTLIGLLEKSQSNKTQALTADCVARLSHCRAGLAAAMVSIDVVSFLCRLLSSPSGQVKGSAAIALSFLSLHPLAERQLLRRCREDPEMMKVLIFYNKKRRWPENFLERWRHMRALTLPPIRNLSTEGHTEPRSPRRMRIFVTSADDQTKMAWKNPAVNETPTDPSLPSGGNVVSFLHQ